MITYSSIILILIMFISWFYIFFLARGIGLQKNKNSNTEGSIYDAQQPQGKAKGNQAIPATRAAKA